ncbi:MAG: hypothetical protein J6K48_05895 [Lachnospiraceae bacterium]|nr:hypothetical protein [Lachnospiraceae bacterium]
MIRELKEDNRKITKNLIWKITFVFLLCCLIISNFYFYRKAESQDDIIEETKEKEKLTESYQQDLVNQFEEEIEAYQNKYISLYTSNVETDSTAFVRTEKEEVTLDDSGSIADVTKYYDAATDVCLRYEVSVYGETMNMVINYYFCDHFIWVSRLQNHYGSWILSKGQDVFWSEVGNWVIEDGAVYRIYDNHEWEQIEQSEIDIPLMDEVMIECQK